MYSNYFFMSILDLDLVLDIMSLNVNSFCISNQIVIISRKQTAYLQIPSTNAICSFIYEQLIVFILLRIIFISTAYGMIQI